MNAPVTFGAHELVRVLPEYLATYPEVEVELTLADRVIDLIDEGYDAIFRVGPLTDSSLIARSLRSMEFMVCAAPAYVEAHRAPATPSELNGHECVGFSHWATRDQWSFRGPEGTEIVEMSCRVAINNGQALLTAALAGLGILLQPAALVQNEIEAGRLLRLLPGYTPLS